MGSPRWNTGEFGHGCPNNAPHGKLFIGEKKKKAVGSRRGERSTCPRGKGVRRLRARVNKRNAGRSGPPPSRTKSGPLVKGGGASPCLEKRTNTN